jgi:hypothetical protein
MNEKFLMVLLVFVVGAGAFFVGMKYQASKDGFNPQLGQLSGNQNLRGQFGQNAQGNRFAGSRPITGEILSQDDKSITVKLSDGSSKIVFLPDNIKVEKTSDASRSDLKVGEKVGVFGTTNSDGSVTAQNVQLNPQVRAFMGNPSGTPSAVRQ